MDQPHLIHFISYEDTRGQLVSLESGRQVPFDIRRVYYMSQMAHDQPRGFHAHRDLRQVAICVAGRCTFVVDNGTARSTFVLDRTDVGLYIGNYIWREMHDFSSDCVLLVLASEYYSEDDYIRDYDEFISEVDSLEK